MNVKKQIWALLLYMVMLLCMVACGSSSTTVELPTDASIKADIQEYLVSFVDEEAKITSFSSSSNLTSDTRLEVNSTVAFSGSSQSGTYNFMLTYEIMNGTWELTYCNATPSSATAISSTSPSSRTTTTQSSVIDEDHTTEQPATSTSMEEFESTATPVPELYPLDGNPSLSIFMPYQTTEDLWSTEQQQQTGIYTEFTMVDETAAPERYNLMIASDKCTDIVVDYDAFYLGGATALYKDGLIIDFSTYLEDYAPDYITWLSENEAFLSDLFGTMNTNLVIYGIDFGDGTGLHTASISIDCKDPEAALAFLNYFFIQ